MMLMQTVSIKHCIKFFLRHVFLLQFLFLDQNQSHAPTATLSARPNPPDQSLTTAATRSEPDLVNSDVPITAATQKSATDSEVTNTGNEVETDKNQAESSYNQSCTVTQTTDTMSAVCSASTPETVESEIDVIPTPLTSLYHEHYQHMNDHQLKKEAERVFYSKKISNREATAIERATVACIALCSGEISAVDT